MARRWKKLGWERDSYIISSKVMWGLERKSTPTQMVSAASISSKLRSGPCERMKVDYLDLYFCHRPDPEVPMEKLLRGMTELILRGKVFYWGTSEMVRRGYSKSL